MLWKVCRGIGCLRILEKAHVIVHTATRRCCCWFLLVAIQMERGRVTLPAEAEIWRSQIFETPQLPPGSHKPTPQKEPEFPVWTTCQKPVMQIHKFSFPDYGSQKKFSSQTIPEFRIGGMQSQLESIQQIPSSRGFVFVKGAKNPPYLTPFDTIPDFLAQDLDVRRSGSNGESEQSSFNLHWHQKAMQAIAHTGCEWAKV